MRRRETIAGRWIDLICCLARSTGCVRVRTFSRPATGWLVDARIGAVFFFFTEGLYSARVAEGASMAVPSPQILPLLLSGLATAVGRRSVYACGGR